jgi:transcriptional regulator with XRE-family HTH domain
MKTAERARARRLRREQGLSVKRLASLLGVSTSSVSLWVRDVKLTAEQIAALRQAGVKGGAANAARGLARRRAAQAEGRSEARRHDPDHVAGCMLFWAEGSRNKNAVLFTNSDPAMVRFFVHFLRTSFDVQDERIRVTCNLFADHSDRQWEIEEFWLRLLDLPRTSLCKSTVNRYSKYSQKKRQNKLPHGTCRIAVHDTKIVQHIYGAIQEYGGFEREAWVM